MGNSNRTKRVLKASDGRPQPPKGCPLFPHRTGRWAKKINGALQYFGQWGRRQNGELVWVDDNAGLDAAVELYRANADALHSGRTKYVQHPGDNVTVADLCNTFLESKLRKVEAGRLTLKSWKDYERCCKRLARAFHRDRPVKDLTAGDFERLRVDIEKGWGPVATGGEIQRVRTIFKYGFEAGLFDTPMRFGPEFKRPDKAELRKERNKRPARMLEAAEIRALLDAAGPQLRAMILLGVNCGLGNTDCGTLPMQAVDLDAGWINYPRPKTGVTRRAKLWPETVNALRLAMAERRSPKQPEYSDRVFITRYRQPWINGNTANPVSSETTKLLRRPRCPECGKINEKDAKACGCGWKPQGKQKWTKMYREGVSFYTLRHVFRTVADETLDSAAIDLVMGHHRNDMASIYRQRISDARLEAVAEHVRVWLFGAENG